MTIPRPGKIVCIGRNYVAHAAELGHAVPKQPLIFLKPPSAVIGPGEAIVLPPQSRQVEHEAEIGVVMKRTLRRADIAQVPAAIAGITCVNDVTARDLQKSDDQWTRAKGFDTFCPIGPEVVPVDSDRLTDLAIVCRVNGAERQRGRTRDMVFPITALVAYISHIMTLEPGDLIVTGTPEGVGPLRPGDTVEVEIPGVCLLSNPVAPAGS